MKKILLIVFLIAGFSTVQAQDFKYEDITDNPEDINIIQAGIGLWDMDLNGYNMQLWNLNPRLYAQISEKFAIEAEYSRSLVDRFYPYDADPSFDEGTTVLKSIYKSEAARKGSIIGTFYFANTIKKEDITHHLKSEGNVSYVSSIPTNVLHSYGVRLGYTQGSSFFALGDKMLTDLQRVDIPTQVDNPYFNSDAASTIVDYSFVRLGFSSTSVINKIINTDKYGEKKYHSNNYWYIDAFIRTKFEADQMYYNTIGGMNFDEIQLFPVTINNKGKLPVGGCIGYRKENAAKHGVGVGMELGLLPGFKDEILKSGYLRINISYQFAHVF